MEPSGVRAAAAAATQLQYARADVHADGFPDGVVSSLRGLHQSALGFCIYGEEKGRRPVRRADVVSHPNHGAVVHSVRFAPSESGSQRHLEAHRDGRPNDHEQTNDTAAGISTAIVHADLFAHCEADHSFANGNLQADTYEHYGGRTVGWGEKPSQPRPTPCPAAQAARRVAATACATFQ